MEDYLTTYIDRLIDLHIIDDDPYCKIIHFESDWLLSKNFWSDIIWSSCKFFYILTIIPSALFSFKADI
jgi:hypothetical protein